MPPTTIDDNKFKDQQMNSTLFLGEFKIGLGQFQQSSKNQPRALLSTQEMMMYFTDTNTQTTTRLKKKEKENP